MMNIQVLTYAYCLNMAMKSLMYYVVLIPAETSPTFRNILNVFWRGLCVQDSVSGRFCQPPNPLTMTQAALVVPILILVLLYVPTILYVLVLSVCNAKKGMRVIDHAILFIFPIFTNLYFNFKSDISASERTGKSSAALQWRARARSHSTPNLSKSVYNYNVTHRKRFCVFIRH